jgi:hypothetical protein
MAGAGATSHARARLPCFRHGLQAQPGMDWLWAISAARLGQPSWAGFGPVADKLFSNFRFCLFKFQKLFQNSKIRRNL